jgi:hypothetical protein
MRNLTFAAALVLVAGGAGATAAEDGARKLTAADRQVLARDAYWGVICPLADGSLGVTIQHFRPAGEPGGTNVSLEWLRSTDGGKTWSEPVVVAERRGPDGKLYSRRPDGGYIVYEQRNQAQGQLPSGRIVCAMAELDYQFDSQGRAEKMNHLGSSFVFANVVYTWSDDLGKTWTKTRVLPLGPFGGKHEFKPYRAASPQWRIVTLKDGTALLSMYGSLNPAYTGPLAIPAGTAVLAGVLRSRDNGETWGDPSLIFTKSDETPWEETALCLVEDRVLAHLRTGEHSVVQYVSTDQGRTWQGPTPLTEPGQQPGGAFRLASGKLLATWGNRRPPYGAAAMLSLDGGKTWDYEHRVSLAWDMPDANCGYANGAQAGDGTIVVVYYGGGAVYAVRFTEAQFVEAAGR